jgi:hypothetical protein
MYYICTSVLGDSQQQVAREPYTKGSVFERRVIPIPGFLFLEISFRLHMASL